MTATTDTPAVPDYTDQPEAYLLHHKWKPLGPPTSSLTRWIDTTKPWPNGVYTREPTFARNGRGETDPVMRRNEEGHVMATHQTHYAPPAQPMTMHEALECQIDRDVRAMGFAADEGAQRRLQGEQEAMAKAMRKLEALAAAGALDDLPVSYSGTAAGSPASQG